jgi:DNA adenine methylase
VVLVKSSQELLSDPYPYVRPFLKWAGGKFRLASRIRSTLPVGNKLIEPFLGSGAVFLNTDYDNYLLGDINQDLINLYTQLKRRPKSFINYCQDWFKDSENNKSAYYHWRQTFNDTTDINLRSALFVYINRHGYNGLCRYNSSGKINVPFGSYKKPYFPADEMFAFAEKAKKATFVCADYHSIMNRARRGHVVYCDPPYVPLTDSANFTSYSKNSFGLDDQMELAVKARHLAQRGVPVIISNHLNGFTRELYEHATIESFDVQRFISCKGDKRGSVEELLASYLPDL